MVKTHSLRAAVKPGFLFYQVDFTFPLALVSAIFRLGWQKNQLDCGHRGMGFDTIALELQDSLLHCPLVGIKSAQLFKVKIMLITNTFIMTFQNKARETGFKKNTII